MATAVPLVLAAAAAAAFVVRAARSCRATGRRQARYTDHTPKDA